MDFEEKTITEKTSYVKGLAEGLSLGDTAQDKLIKALIDLVDDMAVEIADLQEELDDLYDELDELEEQVDAVDEDLGEVEDFIWDDEDFDDWDASTSPAPPAERNSALMKTHLSKAA